MLPQFFKVACLADWKQAGKSTREHSDIETSWKGHGRKSSRGKPRQVRQPESPGKHDPSFALQKTHRSRINLTIMLARLDAVGNDVVMILLAEHLPVGNELLD